MTRKYYRENPMDSRLVWIADIIGVRSDTLAFSEDDVFVRDVGMRLGYFHGNVFFRENPCSRIGRIRTTSRVGEGSVDEEHEPQYDLVIEFDDDGNVIHIADHRTSSEIAHHRRLIRP